MPVVTTEVAIQNNSTYGLIPAEPFALALVAGDFKSAPRAVPPSSTGVAVQLKNEPGEEQIAGLVAYKCAEIDPSQLLVFVIGGVIDGDNTSFSAAAGLLSADRDLTPEVVERLLQQGQAEGFGVDFNWEFEKNGQIYRLLIQCSSGNEKIPITIKITEGPKPASPLGDIKQQVATALAVTYGNVMESTQPSIENPKSSPNAPQALGFGIETQFYGRPIHENLLLASLMASKFALDSNERYPNLDEATWEFIRGVFWNDDPACELFNDENHTNHSLGVGLDWLWEYERPSGSKNIIQRSHHGDLQFLHAMATKNDQPPQETLYYILEWCKLAYNIAIGDVSEWTRLKETNLGPVFDRGNSYTPNGDSTVRDLFLATTPSYYAPQIPRRALGSLLHTIQDSYARGHCQRTPKNPQDRDMSAPGWSWSLFSGKNYIKYKEGTYGQFGDIEKFHCFHGQNEADHKHYDGASVRPGDLVPSELHTFNKVIGARDAIDACTRIIDFWVEKKKWDEGPKKFLEEEIFKLVSNSEASDNNVD